MRSCRAPSATERWRRIGAQADLALDTFAPGGERLVVTTEQDLLDVEKGVYAEVTPRTGAVSMDFPLAVSGTAPVAVKDLGRELVTWFSSPAGRDVLAGAGLRGGDGKATGQGRWFRAVKALPTPTKKDVDANLGTWRLLSAPSSILAVFDVSGSMDFDAPEGGTRIDLAIGVARTALGIFPDHARIGLWAFSVAQDGPRDYRVMEPVRRLDAEVRGVSQRARCSRTPMRWPTSPAAGPDSTTPRWRRTGRRPRTTTRTTATPSSCSPTAPTTTPARSGRRLLLRELKKLRDPQKPVRIVAIGLTGDADMDALSAIAGATGGRAYQTNTAEDIVRVFSQEIAAR